MRTRLAVLGTGDGREMPRHLRVELDRLCRRLVTILELIREVEAERDEVVTTNPEHQTSRKIVALCRIRGRRAVSHPGSRRKFRGRAHT